MRPDSARRGTVLIVVAGLLAALAIIGFTFLISVSGRQAETRYYYQLEQARQAAASGVEYCFGAADYIKTMDAQAAGNNPMTGIAADTAQAAVLEASQRLFRTPSDYSFYNLECQAGASFPHDAFSTDPTTQAILRDYGGTIAQNVLDKIDPVAALYSCSASTAEIPTGQLSDPPSITPGGSAVPLQGGPAIVPDFFVYGWGRVYTRIPKSGSSTEFDYLPVCEEASEAKLKIYIKGQVSIPDAADPTRKVYDFWIDKITFTERKRIAVSDLPQGLRDNGKTWFLH